MAHVLETRTMQTDLQDSRTEFAAVEVCIPPLTQPYTYLVPNSLLNPHNGLLGFRVSVPLGSKRVEGFITKVLSFDELNTEFTIKPIGDDKSPHPAFSAEALELYQWIANYYHHPLSLVLEVAVPPYAKTKKSSIISLCEGASSSLVKGEKQQQIIKAIEQNGGTIDQIGLSRLFRNSATTLTSLVKKGLIQIKTNDMPLSEPALLTSPDWAHRSVALDEQQHKSLSLIQSALDNNQNETFLLHGVTGSGKTEVYIEAIKYARALGKRALVLVPEIALTPQLIDRFTARFSEPIAVLHSGINKKNRWQAWQSALSGTSGIVIGARSAIFCPLSNLGIVIVDEEHDPSFKQQDGLRYNARDLAIVRAKFSSCPVVLGSATPSLETYNSALQKKYTLLSLSQRHKSGSSLKIECVDMSKKRPWELASRSISPELFNAIADTLEEKGQTFILYNRRGFASYLQCTNCEHVLTCPHCDLAYTYHRSKHSLLCHYCSASMRPPSGCKECQGIPKETGKPPSNDSAVFAERGAGTERVFEELQDLFPNANIDRLDRDTASSVQEYQQILDKVREGKTDILVGTQLIAKGHDLPNVLLVGVVDCDIGIHMPDFRAGERVFQLLTQVSGRAGRGSKSGRVILQTRVPEHQSIQSALTGNFSDFASAELKARQRFRYPPFTRLLRITAQAEEAGKPMQVLAEVRMLLDSLLKNEKVTISVLGPTPAPMVRLRNKWRAQLLVKADRISELQKTMGYIRLNLKRDRKCPIVLDIDPLEML
jgi:primosomal protein N' (replication factor Y) (superfamily II helicase)